MTLRLSKDCRKIRVSKTGRKEKVKDEERVRATVRSANEKIVFLDIRKMILSELKDMSRDRFLEST